MYIIIIIIIIILIIILTNNNNNMRQFGWPKFSLTNILIKENDPVYRCNFYLALC